MGNMKKAWLFVLLVPILAFGFSQLSQPSRSDVIDFLAADPTNQGTYDAKFHNCWDFAAELVTNARAVGLDASVKTVRFADGREHAIVAFRVGTDDILVEPQTDDIFLPIDQINPRLCVTNDACFPAQVVDIY